MYSFESIIRCKLSETRQTLTVILMVLTRILTTLRCRMTGIRALCQYPCWQHAALHGGNCMLAARVWIPPGAFQKPPLDCNVNTARTT